MCYKERPSASPGPGKDPRRWAPLAEVLALGLTMGICLALGIGLGIWLDDRFGWHPWGAGLGILWGLGAAIGQAWRTLSRSLHDRATTGAPGNPRRPA
ncbi:MAG: AtpZ/AtpI family protein [Candidatus Riflebacteria bacterium]|nr:AtpZ/AtpI family protein [Candidatus Riflebacteria bacterium]